jgi:hypothetical protein
LAILAEHPRDANAMLERSITNGWQGIFRPGESRGERQPASKAYRPEYYSATSAAELLKDEA